MRRCCFIVPYFGILPNYFQLFLNSCAYNKNFNWLVFTDDEREFRYPKNVIRVKMTFNQLKVLVQSKFDFPISLDSPYKLCDYKPAYGYIFESYLNDFKFWGHCDVDTIMGNLEDFLQPNFMDQYDKMFCLGHMTIYKNTIENNRIFMSVFRDRTLFREVFQTPEIRTFDEEWRDEYNINQIFLEAHKKVYQEDLSLNFSIYYTNFHRTIYRGRDISPDGRGYEVERFRKALYLWNNGRIERYYNDALGNLIKEEFLYLHLQKRKMKLDSGNNGSNVISIVPNEFIPLNEQVVSRKYIQKAKSHSRSREYYYSIISEKYKSMKKSLKTKVQCLIKR